MTINFQNDENFYNLNVAKEYKLEILIKCIIDNPVGSKNVVAIIENSSPHRSDLIGKQIRFNHENKYYKYELLKKYEIFGELNPNKEKDIIYIDNFRLINKYQNKHKYLKSQKREISDMINRKSVIFGWAMLTGDRTFLENKDLEKFSKTATLHLFAVSGLHIGFFYFILSCLLKPFNLNRFNLLIIKFLVCNIFLLLIDFPYSGIRAFCMIYIFDICCSFNVKQKRITFFLLTLLLIIFFLPKIIFSLSAQLSFMVVLFILLILPKNQHLYFSRHHVLNKIILFFLISLSASCGSSLLIFDHFSYFPFLSVLINFLIIPFIFLFYCLNLLYLFFFNFFNSHLFLSVQSFFYDLIYFIIDCGYGFTLYFPNTIKLDINDIFHFVIFISILLSYCFRIRYRLKLAFVIIYYCLIWSFCYFFSF